MKKYLYLGLVFSMILIVGCNSAKQYLKHGNYDAAAKTAAYKLLKNNTKKKMILVLEEAYPKAIQVDIDRINYLHTEGRADRWEEIFLIYDNMKERQTLVEKTYPLYVDGREVRFQHEDYDQKIVEAKVKAADYFYNHAKQLMASKNKFSYRQAFNEFLKAQTYSSSYLDADILMDSCYNLGQSHILLIAVNNTPFRLNNQFFINLIAFPNSQLNGFWHKYYSTDQRKGNYDIIININLTRIDVTPDGKSVREYSETATIQDGWEYKVDANGNVMKDSLGNPIKVPKNKNISCKIIETRQFKTAHLEGVVNYVDKRNGQVVMSLPVAADNIFENYYSVAQGDERALKNETKAKLKNRPAPYPIDIDMIYNANETLRGVIYNVLMDKKGYIEANF